MRLLCERSNRCQISFVLFRDSNFATSHLVVIEWVARCSILQPAVGYYSGPKLEQNIQRGPCNNVKQEPILSFALFRTNCVIIRVEVVFYQTCFLHWASSPLTGPKHSASSIRRGESSSKRNKESNAAPKKKPTWHHRSSHTRVDRQQNLPQPTPAHGENWRRTERTPPTCGGTHSPVLEQLSVANQRMVAQFQNAKLSLTTCYGCSRSFWAFGKDSVPP